MFSSIDNFSSEIFFFSGSDLVLMVDMKRIRDDVYVSAQFKRPFGSSRGDS